MVERDNLADKILVAMDGSPAAKAAAGMAIQLARRWGLPVAGIYVVDEALVLNSYSNYTAEVGADAIANSSGELLEWFRARGDAALGWLENKCREAGLAVSSELLLGAVPDLVLQRADATTLLALGRRGLGHKDDRDYLGRHFKAIAHRADVPMLIGADDPRSFIRVLLAYNRSEHARRALDWAMALQNDFGSNMTVLAMAENDSQPADWLSEIDPDLEGAGLRGYTVVTRSGRPGVEIVDTAVEAQADLIVMGGYRHTALLEWLIGSTLDRVLRGTELPVLIA